MRCFSFKLKDESAVRAMTRQQYKAHTHWLRFAARAVDRAINWDKVQQHVLDVMTIGSHEINYADMLV